MEKLRIGHSPDADDAFMFYGFAAGKVTIEGYEVEQVLEDIESLNHRAMKGELEVTAISAAAYPRVADQYRIMSCGASVGRDYGPLVLSRAPLASADLEGKSIGIPGQYTTAYLLLRIYLGRPFVPVFLNFDQVGDAVKNGKVDAGVIIHEGQITWQAQGFNNVLDLGVAWGEDTGLPIPLGAGRGTPAAGGRGRGPGGPGPGRQHTLRPGPRRGSHRLCPSLRAGHRPGDLQPLRAHVRER